MTVAYSGLWFLLSKEPTERTSGCEKKLGHYEGFLAVNEVSECIIVFYCCSTDRHDTSLKIINTFIEKKFGYEGWNFNSGNYLFTTDTK